MQILKTYTEYEIARGGKGETKSVAKFKTILHNPKPLTFS